MTALAAGVRVVAASTRKELLVMRRYPVAIAVLLGWALLLPLAYVAQANGFSGSDAQAVDAFAGRAGTRQIAAYLYLGWAVYLWVTLILWGPGQNLRDEQLRGSFEAMFMTPTPRFALLIGGAPAQLVPAALVFTVVATMLKFAFGVPLGLATAGWGLLAIFAALPALVSLGCFFSVLVLRFRDADTMVSFTRGLVAVLCGVTYPLAVLPGWLQPISRSLPPTAMIGLLRWAVLTPGNLSRQYRKPAGAGGGHGGQCGRGGGAAAARAAAGPRHRPAGAVLMGATLAVMRRNLLIARRYPFGTLNMTILTPLYEMALPTILLGAAFLVGGQATGLSSFVGTTDLAGWLADGMLVASLTVGTMFAVSSVITTDRDTGALEQLWTTPIRRDVVVVGSVLTSFLYSLVANTLLILLAIGLLGARYQASTVFAVPAVAVMLVGLCGYGYLAGAGALALRRSGGLLDGIGYVVAVLSGVAFPIAVLPVPFRVPAMLLPTTWGLDLLRHWGQGSKTVAPVGTELVALVLTSAAFLVAGRLLFARTERSLRRAGTLNQH